MISITKILITIAVMIGVALFFRTNVRPERGAANKGRQKGNRSGKSLADERKRHQPSVWVYALASGLIIVGVVVFYLRWLADHKVVEIRVIDGEYEVVYEAYQKDIKGKTFTAIDGRQVTVGENQRIETLTR